MIYTVTIQQPDDLDEFRRMARRLLAARIAPADVVWSSAAGGSLFCEPLPDDERIMAVPRSFVTLASVAICHRDEQRWPLLYEALWRMDLGERGIMERASDPLVYRLRRLAAAVKHDQHRMTAFVRFREVPGLEGDCFVAWYEPRHHVLRRAASFFIDRFANMRFSILTPDLTLYWDRNVEMFSPGLRKEDAVSADAVEDWWRRYYAAIFNPARLNVSLMQQHMPKRFWRDLPEAKIILELINGAEARTDRMIQSAYPSDDQ